jgi:hypothetical protein
MLPPRLEGQAVELSAGLARKIIIRFDNQTLVLHILQKQTSVKKVLEAFYFFSVITIPLWLFKKPSNMANLLFKNAFSSSPTQAAQAEQGQ